MKKFVSIITIIILVAGTILSGCKKEEQQVEPTTAQSTIDKKMENFARSLAKSLDNASNVNELKSKIAQTFDGDYDVLYAQLRYNSLKAASRFTQSIEKGLNTSVEELLNEQPLLNIAVPYISEDINVNNLSTSPWVSYIPENFQEGKTKYITAYNAAGETKQFSAETLPNEPVVVVGCNERVIATPKGKKAAVKGEKMANISGGNFDYYFVPVDNGGGGSNNGGSGNTQTTTRIDGGSEYVKYIHFTNIQQVESWVKGAPEIRLRVFSAEKGNLLSYFFAPRRRDCENKDYYINYSMFNWHWYDYGNFILLDWYEEDGGSTITVGYSTPSSKYGSISVSYTIKDKDDPIGYHVVNKEDSKYQKYDTGIMYWYENF